MRKSTDEEIRSVDKFVIETRDHIAALIESGNKVHLILDFDGVIADTRSDDVFTVSGHNLKTYFAHEERMLLAVPGRGPWLLPLIHEMPGAPRFPHRRFSFDIVTARSSALAIRVHMFSMMWSLNPRWMLFVGHQSKKESYRIILKSFKDDLHAHVFCIDDNAAHVATFSEVSAEENMQERARGIVTPIVRMYDEKELKEYLARVMRARGTPIRVRDPSDDMRGFLVLPEGIKQFKPHMQALQNELSSQGHHAELRAAFVRIHGEVGKGTFKTEEELEQAMRDFILSIACP